MIEELLRRLSAAYPEARPLLHYRNAFEFLIAVILSAQTTDEGVNRVSVELFSRYPDASSLSTADPADVERILRPIGFFRLKARNIVAAARLLLDHHGGEVPSAMDDLLALPGVGRKTANAVRANIFGLPGIIVDTHLMRVTRRLGLSAASGADAIERELGELLPPERWSEFSMRINHHGRRCCMARRPACPRCPLAEICPHEPKTVLSASR